MQRLVMRVGYRWLGLVLSFALLTFVATWYAFTPLLGPIRLLLVSIVVTATITLSLLSLMLLGLLAGPLHENLRATVTSNATAGFSLAELLGSDDLPALGGWSMEPDAAVALARTAVQHCPQRVLELGPGASSELLLRSLPQGASVRALEHDAGWLEVVRRRISERAGGRIELHHAPLRHVITDGWRGMWYDLEGLEGLHDIDLLVVDGPPGPSRALARFPALPLLEPVLADRALIFVDDAGRPDETTIVERWLRRPGVRLLDRGPNWVLLVRDVEADA